MPLDLGLATLGGAALSAGGGIFGGIMGNNQAKKDAKKLEEAINKANKANEARYQQMLSDGDNLRLDSLGALNTQYAQLYNMNDAIALDAAKARNEQATGRALGANQQAMVGRGLFNSTAATNAEGAIRREGDLRDQEIENQALDRRMALGQRYTDLLLNQTNANYGARMGAVGSVQDQGPNVQAYASLMAANRQSNPFATGVQALGAAIPAAVGASQQQQFNRDMLQTFRRQQNVGPWAGAYGPQP